MLKSAFLSLVFLCSTLAFADAVATRISTERVENKPAVRVTWVDWDSSFRNSNLQVGDRIIGVNDANLSGGSIRFDEAFMRTAAYPGGYNEESFWDKNGALDNEAIELIVIRDGKELTIPGELRTEKFYHTPDNRLSLGDNGPVRMSRGDFSDGKAWAFWYEDFCKNASSVLDNAWNKNSVFDNRKELKSWIENNEERVKFLASNHPGRFATSVASDYQIVKTNLEGQKIIITPASQEWRKFGIETVRRAKALGLAKSEAVKKEKPSQWVRPFPAPDPITGKLGRYVGRFIDLPRLSERDMTTDLGKTYFVLGSQQDGYWIIPGKTPLMDRFFDTYFQFKAQYSAEIRMSFYFYARITAEPKMIEFKGQTITGLIAEPFAAFVGDPNGDPDSVTPGYFIDLRVPPSVPVPGSGRLRIPFAGEESLPHPNLSTPPVGASPTEVLTTLFSAIKYSNQELWMSLFADWDFYKQPPYPPVFRPDSPYNSGAFRSAWQEARALLTDFADQRPDVIDVRVNREFPIVRVYPGDSTRGIPPIEEVKVLVDHVIRATPDSRPDAYDGEFRTFTNMYVHRIWRLQRLGPNAPWKVYELQGL